MLQARIKTPAECLQTPLIDILLPEESETYEEIQALKLRAAKLILRKPVKGSNNKTFLIINIFFICI